MSDDTYSIRPNNLKRLVFVEDLQGQTRLQLFADRDLASQFFGEVFEENHVALFLLSRLALTRRCAAQNLVAIEAIAVYCPKPGGQSGKAGSSL